jgi:hypothetical protein
MSDYTDYLENGTPVDWAQYPTYTAYEQILEKWARDYPEICKLCNLGPSVRGKKILALKISDNVNLNEPEPRFLQTSTIHGDEFLNYMFTLHVIDTMLLSYGKDEQINRMIEGIEFWFCPLLNPDATYRLGDHTVEGAQRFNANNKDLHSNWPCPCQSSHHKYGLYDSLELEVKALMGLHNKYTFNLHIDMHAGTEAVLWPYGAVPNRICDEEWYKWMTRGYVDQIHEDCNNPRYMTSCGGDGIGHIYTELYECHGTMVDFCAYFAHIKGMQLENWGIKMLPGERELRQYWPYNKEALFQYYELLLRSGLQGLVTDAGTKAPIYGVNITAKDYDRDSANVYTDSTGFYVRFIDTGTYSFTFSHPDYYPKTVDNVAINSFNEKYELNVEIDRITITINGYKAAKQNISICQTNSGFKILFNEKLDEIVKISIYTIHGKLVKSFDAYAGKCIVWNNINTDVPDGCYIIRLESSKPTLSEKIVLSH